MGGGGSGGDEKEEGALGPNEGIVLPPLDASVGVSITLDGSASSVAVVRVAVGSAEGLVPALVLLLSLLPFSSS